VFTLVIGGAASGKSEYAEELILASPLRPRIYIATMEPFDAEGRARRPKARFAVCLVCAQRAHNSTLAPRKVFFQGACPWKNDWIVFAACGRQTPVGHPMSGLTPAEGFLTVSASTAAAS